MPRLSLATASGTIPASNLQPGDRFWNPHHHTFRTVTDSAPPVAAGGYQGQVFVAFELDGPDSFGSAWFPADAAVTVQLPRQQRERETLCFWCRGRTTNPNRVCDQESCGDAETAAQQRRARGHHSPSNVVPLVSLDLSRSMAQHPSNNNGGGAA